MRHRAPRFWCGNGKMGGWNSAMEDIRLLGTGSIRCRCQLRPSLFLDPKCDPTEIIPGTEVIKPCVRRGSELLDEAGDGSGNDGRRKIPKRQRRGFPFFLGKR